MTLLAREQFTVKLKNTPHAWKIAAVADLHLCGDNYRKHLENLIETLATMKPDYIAMVGDYGRGLNSKMKLLNPEARARLLIYLDAIREIAKVVMSMGNHDLSRRQDEELRASFLDLSKGRDNVFPVDREKTYTDEELKAKFFGYMQPLNAYAVCETGVRKSVKILDDMVSHLDTILNSPNEMYDYIGLVHTPSLFYNDFLLENNAPIFKAALAICAHEHGGYLSANQVNKLIKGVEILKGFFPQYADRLEQLKYIGLCESITQKYPCIVRKARGMHILGPEANPTQVVINTGTGEGPQMGFGGSDPNTQSVSEIIVIPGEITSIDERQSLGKKL